METSSSKPTRQDEQTTTDAQVAEVNTAPPASDMKSPLETSKNQPSSHFRGLIDQLTTEEKVALLSGSSFTTTTGVARLGIPQLKVSDSINGVRGSQSHLEDRGTACFPSTTCLASTWDAELMTSFGEEVGIQAKLKSVQVVIGPNVNLHRDPRGGRNFETFSEDPLLTGRLAASIINGMQSTGVGACAKHFAGNESETKRRKYNVRTSGQSRTMRELYMKAFQIMLRESNPASIMMAYNKIDGHYCSQSPLIQQVLRQSWKYDGCIMSDWYGTCSGPESLRAGLDLEMPGPTVFRGARLLQELESGVVSKSDLDRAVHSVLNMLDKTAESHSEDTEQTVICERTSAMARQLAAEGIVMLKNARNVLPLDVHGSSKIAVIGAGAKTPIVTGGGSAHARPQYTKNVLDLLRIEHPSPEMVRYAQGVSPHHCVPLLSSAMLSTLDGKPGIYVEYFNDDSPDPVHSESSDVPQVIMLGRLKPGLNQQNFHYVITTTLTVPTSGQHTLGAQVTGDFTLNVDGTTILQGAAPAITVEDFLFVPKRLERTTTIYLEANKPYSVRLLVRSRVSVNNGEPTPHSAKLVFQEAYDDQQSIADAVTIAAESDTSIIITGRTHEHESEGFDLPHIDLEPSQIRLIKAVAAVSKNTVLVLHHGNPIDLSPVVDDVDTILAAHFPGQEGATALTDIIVGRANPSGRLATTWPLRLDETCVPSFANFPCTDGDDPSIDYAEGLKHGYRNPSVSTVSRFVFGHGLGYSTFSTSDLEVSPTPEERAPPQDRTITATVKVHNSGSRAGKHVVQLYVEAPQTDSAAQDRSSDDPDSWRPYRQLVSFAKTSLMPGETKTVQMKFPYKDVTSIWDEKQEVWRCYGGNYGFVVAEDAVKAESCRVQLDLEAIVDTWDGL